MFFLMSDCAREVVEPCLLAREIDVALDIEVVSFMLVVLERGAKGATLAPLMALAWIQRVGGGLLTSRDPGHQETPSCRCHVWTTHKSLTFLINTSHLPPSGSELQT